MPMDDDEGDRRVLLATGNGVRVGCPDALLRRPNGRSCPDHAVGVSFEDCCRRIVSTRSIRRRG